MKRRRFLQGLLLIFATMSIAFVVIAYRWTSHHIWFLSDIGITVDGKDMNERPLLYDYLPNKSLSGDILLRNQDHGTQYLISVQKKEVSIISEDVAYVDVHLVTYMRDDLVDYKYNKVKKILPNANMVVKNNAIEFTSDEGELWHLTY